MSKKNITVEITSKRLLNFFMWNMDIESKIVWIFDLEQK